MIRRFLVASVLFLFCLQAVNAQEHQQAPPESGDMKKLFDGESLAGWDGDPRLWSVQDGVIRGETTKEKPAKGNTFLIWKDGKTADFELRLSFRCNASNNSGIQYRSEKVEDASNDWVVKGYQHEIRNEDTLPSVSGFIYGEKLGRGRICLVGEQAVIENGEKKVTGQLINQAEFKELFKLDDWNEVVIVAQGRQIRHYLNGRLILDFTDSPELALKEGVLALQLHGGNPMWAEFKDIRMKDL